MVVALISLRTYTPDALQQFDWFITGVIVVNIGLMAATIRNQPAWWTKAQVGSSELCTRPIVSNQLSSIANPAKHGEAGLISWYLRLAGCILVFYHLAADIIQSRTCRTWPTTLSQRCMWVKPPSR